MNKRIVYTRPDGGVSILIPSPNARLEGETDDALIARIRARDVPDDATHVSVCDASEIPADRTFRNAWKRSGKSVQVDMPEAREIHMARIREVRNAKLAQMDIAEKLAAQGVKGDLQTIRAKMQALRDIPQTLDLTQAKTPEQLKTLWPEELDRPSAT